MNTYFKKTLKALAEAVMRKETMSPDMLTKEAYDKYPKKIYKFRSMQKQSRENTLAMLNDEYLWAANPSTFDDNSDSRLDLPNDFEKQIQQWFNSHLAEMWFYGLPRKGMRGKKFGHTLKDYIKLQNQFIDEKGKVRKQELTNALRKMLHGLPQQEYHRLRKEINSRLLQDSGNFIINGWKERREGIVNSFRNESLIACVTQTYKNRKMWEDYADKYRGIVVEYVLPAYDDLTDEQKVLLLHLFKVSYCKRIPKISLTPLFEWVFQKNYYGKETDISDFMAELYEQVLYKDKDYVAEREWRFVDCGKGHKIDVPFIRRVFAGYKISPENLKEIEMLCKERGYRLFLQKEDPSKREFDYVEHSLNEV